MTEYSGLSSAPGALRGARIIIVLRNMAGGGSQTQALLLADILKNHSMADVSIWSFQHNPACAEKLDGKNIHWEILPPFYQYPRFRKLWGLLSFIRRLRSAKPHIIMPFNNLPNKLCCAVWKLTGARVCIWNQRDEGRDVDRGFIEKTALKHAPAFISNSGEGRNFLVRRFGVDPQKITIIFNGAALPEARQTPQQWRSFLEIPDGSPLAVMLANLTRFKDHQNLLMAWSRVLQMTKGKTPAPPVLVLAGKPFETYDDLQKTVRALHMEPYVRFAGFVEDVAGLLASASLGVFSSRFEGCPNGVLECMAAGLPVVSGAITGTQEALGEDYPFLVPVGDPQAMAEHIAGFLTGVYPAREWGERNKRRVAELFSLDRMAQDYERYLSRWMAP